MTDKTDIAGLKDHNIRDFVNELRDGAFKYTGAQCMRDVISRIVHKHVGTLVMLLKAERQRSDDAERANRQQYRDLVAGQEIQKQLEAELAALKGDQVPVSMDSLRDAVAEMSGGLPMEWMDGNDKGHHGVPFINFNSLHRIVTKFTAPQKPVVLRQIGSIDHDGGEYGEYFVEFTDSASLGQAVYVIDSAIEAAGGIVKDGE